MPLINKKNGIKRGIIMKKIMKIIKGIFYIIKGTFYIIRWLFSCDECTTKEQRKTCPYSVTY